MNLRYLFLCAFSIFIINHSVGQRVRFTVDTAYVRELSQFTSKTNNDKVKTATADMQKLWNSGKLTATQKSAVINLSNLMLKKRMRVYPHFYNFERFILSAKNSNKYASHFDKWINFIEQYANIDSINSSKLNKIFIKIDLLNTKGIINQTRAIGWKVKSDKYRIENTNNQFRVCFDKTDLICYSSKDSMFVINTQGCYSPLENKWRGKSGRVTWEQAGLSKENVYAILSNYTIDLNHKGFKAESSKFVNKEHIKQELSGVLEAKLIDRKANTISYPKFTSKTILSIKNIMPDIDYYGSFKMAGNRLLGSANKNKKAVLSIQKDKEIFFKAESNYFVFDFKKNRIDSKSAQIRIKIEEDSLIHNSVILSYTQDSSLMRLMRDGNRYTKSSFFDSYHNMEIDIDMLSFRTNDTALVFRHLPITDRDGIFRSTDYFSRGKYNKMKMRDRVNPLNVLSQTVDPTMSICSLEDFANALGASAKDSRSVAYRLASEGFIHYDKDTETIYALPTVFSYVAANNDVKDYDQVTITSKNVQTCGVINLKNNDLVLYGVKPFIFSYNRRVRLLPAESTITVKEGFDMIFNGRVDAGLIKIYGNKFKFIYDKFLIDMPEAASMQLSFISDSITEDSVRLIMPVESKIENISGKLYIDNASNKSGKDSLHAYPVFESEQTANVYYDSIVSRNKSDSTKKFYFETKPFIIDSLNLLTRSNIRIDGTFVSGDIFPNFKESLTVQKDASLGFRHKTDPHKGIDTYKGQGRYYNEINLDNQGLQGEGRLTYLNSEILSRNFHFFPDSTSAYAHSLEMKKQTGSTKYPSVTNDSVKLHWEPLNKRMLLSSFDEPHNMFEGRVKLLGTLKLEPTLLSGDGALVYKNAELKSDKFKFYDNAFQSDSTSFKLKKEGENIVPMIAENVNANVDFAKDIGIFKSNGGESFIDFKINQYKCYMNSFIWKMTKNKINIGMVDDNGEIQAHTVRENIDITDTTYSANELAMRSKFVSMHPNKDSLSFHAVSATFDMDSFVIETNNIKFIKIADVFLFPADKIVIRNTSEIDEIDGAKILANRHTNYHIFHNVHASIEGGKKYDASGDYEYVDRNEKVEHIHFGSIRTNNEATTVAKGDIPDSINFQLGPQFKYFGDVNLDAAEKYLYFDGYANINHNCTSRLGKQWFPFKSRINPLKIAIPISDYLMSADTSRLNNGIFITKKDSIGMYATFLSKMHKPRDYRIFKTNKAYLSYSDSIQSYEITDSARFFDNKATGNHLKLNKEMCTINGDGEISLGLFLEMVKTKIVGSVYHNFDAMQTSFDAMLGLDFHFDKKALKIMAESFNSEGSTQAVDLSSKHFLHNFEQILGYKEAKKYNEGFSLYGGFDEMPDSMNYTLFLSRIRLKWDNEEGAWVSEGKIGISNFKEHQILKVVNGRMEVKRIGHRGVINLYLEINPDKWFYFHYDDGTLKTCSSDDDYNNRIAKIKEKKRVKKERKGNSSFAYYPANQDSKTSFLREMKDKYNFEYSEPSSIDKDFDLDASDNKDDKNEGKRKGIKKKKDKNKEETPNEEEEEEEEEEED